MQVVQFRNNKMFSADNFQKTNKKKVGFALNSRDTVTLINSAKIPVDEYRRVIQGLYSYVAHLGQERGMKSLQILAAKCLGGKSPVLEPPERIVFSRLNLAQEGKLNPAARHVLESSVRVSGKNIGLGNPRRVHDWEF